MKKSKKLTYFFRKEVFSHFFLKISLCPPFFSEKNLAPYFLKKSLRPFVDGPNPGTNTFWAVPYMCVMCNNEFPNSGIRNRKIGKQSSHRPKFLGAPHRVTKISLPL